MEKIKWENPNKMPLLCKTVENPYFFGFFHISPSKQIKSGENPLFFCDFLREAMQMMLLHATK